MRSNLQRLVRVYFHGCSAVSFPFSNPGIRSAVAPSRESHPGIIIYPNVRGQRTRHLVAGTLDPLVEQLICLSDLWNGSALLNIVFSKYNLFYLSADLSRSINIFKNEIRYISRNCY